MVIYYHERPWTALPEKLSLKYLNINTNSNESHITQHIVKLQILVLTKGKESAGESLTSL